jgi:hypothetical protein
MQQLRGDIPGRHAIGQPIMNADKMADPMLSQVPF